MSEAGNRAEARMGDLVERLRTAIASTLFWYIAPADVVNAVSDALLNADEIECLRARVAELAGRDAQIAAWLRKQGIDKDASSHDEGW